MSIFERYRLLPDIKHKLDALKALVRKADKGPVNLNLILVRHGESMANIRNSTGHEALSEVGIGQAKLLGRHLRERQFQLAYTSNLMRAIQTANLVLCENRRPPTIRIYPKLKERDFGRCNGDVHKLINDDYKCFLQGTVFNPVGGETQANFLHRVQSCFCELCLDGLRYAEEYHSRDDLQSRDVSSLIVGHSCFFHAFAAFLKYSLKCSGPAIESRDIKGLIPPNTGMTEFRVKLTGTDMAIACSKFGNVDHIPPDVGFTLGFDPTKIREETNFP